MTQEEAIITLPIETYSNTSDLQTILSKNKDIIELSKSSGI